MSFEPKYTKDSFSKLDTYGAYIPTIANLIVELQRAYAEIELQVRVFNECNDHRVELIGKKIQLEEQNKTLREALEWYAVCDDGTAFTSGPPEFNQTLVEYQFGAIARKALEKAK